MANNKELGLLDQNGPIDEETGLQVPATAVARRALKLMKEHRFIRFKKHPMMLVNEPYDHYIPLYKADFEELAYDLHGGLTRSQISDIHNYVIRQADKMDDYAHLIRFGITVNEAMLHPELNDYDIMFTEQNRPVLWDTQKLTWLYGEDPNLAVWRCPYPRLRPNKDNPDELPEDTRIPFIMQLAGNDEGVYDDIMQSIAPIIMDKKPDGVIWWVGEGANGKSTLMNALYRLFPGQLTSITVRALEDGRDSIVLNSALANIVKESSEGRVEDTEAYKALGTHEDFRVHKFHSQETEVVRGNIHSIFSANQIPAFNDKGHSAKRRTFIIPFRETFDSDPDFETKTFTAKFFAQLVTEMTKYAQRLKDQNYRYQWSVVTNGAKVEYDREAGVADEYLREMVNDYGLVAFEEYRQLANDFEDWCARNGYTPVGVKLLRKATVAAGFERQSKRVGGLSVGHIYRVSTVTGDTPLAKLSVTQPGLYVVDGFHAAGKPQPVDPEPAEQTSILNNKW